jgi:hypothetical protein
MGVDFGDYRWIERVVRLVQGDWRRSENLLWKSIDLLSRSDRNLTVRTKGGTGGSVRDGNAGLTLVVGNLWHVMSCKVAVVVIVVAWSKRKGVCSFAIGSGSWYARGGLGSLRPGSSAQTSKKVRSACARCGWKWLDSILADGAYFWRRCQAQSLESAVLAARREARARHAQASDGRGKAV